MNVRPTVRLTPLGTAIFLAAMAIAVVLMLLMVDGCSEESALSRLGEACTLTSDCDAGLVCSFRTCHEACGTSKDCPAGRCIASAERVRLCQTDAEALCHFDSECAPSLVCGIDGECRNECASDRDCVPGQVCTTATCADPEELENGRLPPAPDVDPVGKPCGYSSDCLPGPGGLVLECQHGTCAVACYEERDCARFYTCTTGDGTAGDCVLIGVSGQLYCDPDDDPYPCKCLDAVEGTQQCKPDGSELDQCICN